MLAKKPHTRGLQVPESVHSLNDLRDDPLKEMFSGFDERRTKLRMDTNDDVESSDSR